MAAKKVGVLIKEARTNAGLTQAQLAAKVSGLTASDIGKAERGEKELTDAQLKTIAKVTGVTQKSLLEAPKGGTSSSGTTSSSGKTPSSGKTSV
ncbi:MAG: helix-turn-helix transcriptional regulator, partial [Lachnospiraceae bacterium]|nr:helix-turn-helix transcriptional regulator [Lachnospiraceae bacterium]